MNRDLQFKLNQYAKARSTKSKWLTVAVSLCAVVAIATSYLLINPADTAVGETYCGYEEHIEHTEDCYQEVTTLICPLTKEGHIHDDACYEEREALACGKEETEGHIHSAECWQPQTVLACGMQGLYDHSHTWECYDETGTPVCGLEEGHIHTQDCYDENLNLICGLDGTHAHFKSCYDEEGNLICGIPGVHVHFPDTCYDEYGSLICDLYGVHVHDESCCEAYEVLICGQDECEPHTHDESCYALEQVLICGLQEQEPHQHTDECYGTENTLTCTRLLHEHTLQCFSNPEADVETASVWERTFDSVELSGNWNDDVIAIAKTQLGYEESISNYEVQEDGITVKGYTRYGDWYGDTYGDWCAMFCSFCMDYAGVDHDLMPLEASCQRWIEALSEPELNLYYSADTYTPVPGDLVFFDWDKHDPQPFINYSADHIGLVAELVFDEETNEVIKIKTIEGNSGNCVRYNTYELTDNNILGYGELPENPEYSEKQIVFKDPEYPEDPVTPEPPEYLEELEIPENPEHPEESETPEYEARTIESLSASDGAVAVISGMLPEYAQAEIQAVPLSEEEIISYFGTEKAEQMTAYVAYDIRITVDGEEWQPDGAVSVTVRHPEIDLDNSDQLGLAHIEDETNAVTDIDVYMDETDEISFESDGFSIYILYFLSANTDNTSDASFDGILVVAASDFQDPSTSGGTNYTVQSNRVMNILSQIESAYGEADGFLAGGDYNYDMANATKTQNGVNALKGAVTSVMGSDVEMVLVPGNHDTEISDLASTGAYDTDDYGVYAIAQSSYPQRGGTKSTVQATADGLSTYLQAKADADYDKPIFILTHVPLHYSTRCYKEGDAKYASLLFDAISEYGDELNIFFLYGHDHANGNDDYLGGTCVFLTRGDTINIADEGSTTSFTSRELNFTYMDCGFVGYFWDNYSKKTPSVADDTLNMSVFCIDGDTVTVSRWTEDGQYAYLKAVGAAAPSTASHGAEVCPVTTNYYYSPQVVSAPSGSGENPGEDPGEDPEDTTTPHQIPDSAVLSNWDELESADVISAGDDFDAVDSALSEYYDGDYRFSLYDIRIADGATVPEEGVQVYLPAEEEMRVFGIEDGALVWHDGEFVVIDDESYMCFTAYHFSLYGVAGLESGFEFPDLDDEDASETVRRYDEVASLSNGDQVIIQNTHCGNYLSDARTTNNSGNTNGRQLLDVSQDEATVWTVEVNDGNYYLKNSSGRYLSVGNATATLSDSRSARAQYVSGQSCWQIRQNVRQNNSNTTFYLNDYNDAGNRAAGYTSGASDDPSSRWKIYKVTEYVSGNSEYWVRCNDVSDFTLDDTYMIIRGDASFALGTGDNNGAGVTVTTAGTEGSKTRYTITGNGSGTAYQWKFSNISTGSNRTYTLQNAGNSNSYLNLGNNTIISSSGSSNTITNPTQDHEVWQIKSGSYYLRYYDNAFQRNTSNNQSYMYIYKKVVHTTSQLAVQKFVPEFTSNIDKDTEFTFRLVRANTNSISNAVSVASDYVLYDIYGTQIGTGSLNNGAFTLKAGQTALFRNPDVSKYYFVEEAVHEHIDSVTASVNGSNATVGTTGNGNYHYVPVTFSNDRSLVKVTNTAEADEPSLRLSLSLMGSNANVGETSEFEILVTDEDGTPAEYEYYICVDDQGEHTVLYDANAPKITLHPGETVRIFGLEDGTYVVHQYLGENAEYISNTLATVNGTNAAVTMLGTGAEDTVPAEMYFTVSYSGSASAEIVDVLEGYDPGSGGGTEIPPLIPKEPDHHKYIDAFRDGADNPETDLDDKARGDVEGVELDDCIEDLYRLYLDVGPESAYEAIDVLFIVDSSTSMSGYTGYDAIDILGNESWRCFALDTLLLGQGTERSAGANTKYQGSGTQNAAQHQRNMYDNGLISKIAQMNPDNKVAVARFSATSAKLLDWTRAEDVTGIAEYSNVGGTNYVAGMMEALDFLQDSEVVNDGNKKVMIFISDGLPTRYYTSWNPSATELADPAGSGTEEQDEFDQTQTMVSEFRNNSFIKGLTDSGMLDIFTIAVGTGVFSTEADLDARALLRQLSTDGSAYNSTNFQDIMKVLDSKITRGYGHYTNLKVTDTLSDYVDFYKADLDLLIEKIPDGAGTKEILYQNGALTTDGKKYIKDPNGVIVNYNTKTVTVDFLDNYKEEGGYTYRISFNIKTLQDAYDEYAENVEDGKDGYNGATGSGSGTSRRTDYVANGNYTSSGLPGFFSNERAVLEYTQARMDEDGVTRIVEYPHPVVQVWTTDLEITKDWSDGSEPHEDDSVTVEVWMKALPETFDPNAEITEDIRTGGTKIKEVTLDAENNWTYTVEDLPRGYYYYIVEQEDENFSDYVQVYEPFAVAVPHDATGDMEFEVGVTNTKNEQFKYLVLKKTDMAGLPLPGAQFKLYSDEEHTQEVTGLVTSGTDGVFTPEEFTLANGIYYLVEHQAPPGYNGLTEHVILTVAETGISASYNGTPLTVTSETSQDGKTVTYTLPITNSTGYTLPETGGIGTIPYILCGLLLTAGAVYGYVLRRKRERRST